LYCPEAVFIFTSTNKVYGDTPNTLPLIELETRWELPSDHPFYQGIDESMTIDRSKHSIFGVSKVAADIMVQEYGRYFGLKTAVFRGGCLTGPAHSGTKLHGFLAYLIKCIAEGRGYTIYGYKGKQVRDNIHSSDLIQAFYQIYLNPRCGEVYNMGGSRHSNVSMMEAIEKIEAALGRRGVIEYDQQNRSGDHIWYVSDVRKFQSHYPNWRYQYNTDAIIEEICRSGHFGSSQVIAGLVVSQFQNQKVLLQTDKTKIFVSAHITEEAGPVQALKSYLIKKFSRLIFVEHPFAYSGVDQSKVTAFRVGLPAKELLTRQLSSELVSYFRDLILTIYWFLKSGQQVDLFIGTDNLNALAGLILKKLGFCFNLVYYATSYSQHRFKNRLLNWAYHTVDQICARQADYNWSGSNRLQGVREQQEVDWEKNILVKTGINKSLIDSTTNSGKDQNVLVINEHLTKIKGAQLVINSLPAIRQLNPQAKLVVIGTGPYEQILKEEVSRIKVEAWVEFKGELTPALYFKQLSNYGIGLAIYQGSVGSFTNYADPMAVKEYLALGLPVVVSSYLPIAESVKQLPLGVAINYNQQELVEALAKLWFEPGFYSHCARNGLEFVKDLDWTGIFNQVMKQMGME